MKGDSEMVRKSFLSFPKFRLLVIIVIALIGLLIKLGGYKMDSERIRRDRLIEELTTYEWNGTRIDMTGLQKPVTERFKGNMVLVFIRMVNAQLPLLMRSLRENGP